VKVTLGDCAVTTTTGENGKWRVALDLKQMGCGPHELVVEGENRLTISDVLIGEVWLASGQSNMQQTIRHSGGTEGEGSQDFSTLRQFTVPNTPSQKPSASCEGNWTVASPETIGDFSAVGYYFAKTLQNDLKVPVGIIDATWGGTPIEAWISEDALATVPSLKAAKEKIWEEITSYPRRKEQFIQQFGTWLADNGREDASSINPEDFAGESVSERDWTIVTLPGPLKAPGLPDCGVIWIRRSVVPEPGRGGQNLIVEFEDGSRNLFEAVYWNGQKIGELNYRSYRGDGSSRSYEVPGSLVKEGENILAARLFVPVGAPLFDGINFIRVGGIPQGGAWLAKAEKAFAPLPKMTAVPKILTNQPQVKKAHALLFNGMISPIIPYAIKGTLWYQGESNANHAWEYRTAFPLLIADWRNRWAQGDFSFYFCQLPNFMKKDELPTDSEWAELRESQSLTLQVPKTGQAVLIDIGEEGDIHPRNKKDVGERLARIALAKDYGREIVFSGPTYQGMKIEGDKIQITFQNVSGGLVAKELPKTYAPKTGTAEVPLTLPSPESEVQGFSICGVDGKWVWADAKIEGTDVIVWSEKVSEPVAVRYAWANNPTCNLYNGEGLPASPFRTDDFALTTQPR